MPAVSSFDSSADLVGDAIKRIFTEDNVTSKDGASVTFRVRGVDVCVDGQGLVNTACADTVDRLKAHLRVSGDLDIAILLGTDKVEAAVIHFVSGKSIALEYDLASTQAAAKALYPDTATAALAFTGTTKGRMEYKLEKHGDRDFSLSFGVLSDIQVAMKITQPSEVTYTYSVAARSPMMQVRLDANARRFTALVDYGTVKYSGTGLPLPISSNPTTAMEAQLSGLTAQVLIDDSTTKATGLSLGSGPSFFKTGSTTVMQVDLNATMGRKFDVELHHTTDGIRLTAAPGFTVDGLANFGALASETFHPSEELRHSKYTVALTGAPALEFFTRRTFDDGETMPFTKLASGTLTVKVEELSAPGTDNVAVCEQMKAGGVDYSYDRPWCGDEEQIAVPVNCASLPLNSYENSEYLRCVMHSYDCSGDYDEQLGEYVYRFDLNQENFDLCEVLGSRAVPELTFTAPACLGYGHDTGNSMINFFTGSLTCP